MKKDNTPDYDQEETKIFNRVPLEIIILSFAASIVAAFLFDIMTGLFVLVGGAVSAVIFLWVKSSLFKFFLFEKKKKILGSIVGNYIIRIVLIIVIFSIIIIFFSKRIFAFMAGFSTIIIVFFVETIAAFSRMKKWKD